MKFLTWLVKLGYYRAAGEMHSWGHDDLAEILRNQARDLNQVSLRDLK